MKPTFLLVLSLLGTLGLANVSSAKEWRGVVPLRSTRDDVIRLFRTPSQSTDLAFYYSFPNEIAVVWFQSGPCDLFGMGWNIPSGTVTDIGVIPTRKLRREAYLNEGKFEINGANAGFIYYTDLASGFLVETLNGIVTSLEYSPTAQEDDRRCPRTQQCCVDFFPLFDEYENPSFEDEKARLGNHFLAMKEQLGRSVIVVYGRNPKERARRMARAQRGKNYFVKNHALEAPRILIVDGGYRERPATALHLYSIGGVVNRVNLFPEKDPSIGNKRHSK